jgi:hypothetical protein
LDPYGLAPFEGVCAVFHGKSFAPALFVEIHGLFKTAAGNVERRLNPELLRAKKLCQISCLCSHLAFVGVNAMFGWLKFNVFKTVHAYSLLSAVKAELLL